MAELEAEIQKKAVLIKSSLTFLSSLSMCSDVQPPSIDTV